ncbi:multidrug DMT transporter permease [Bacillus sp. SA1-12]|uniref:EamA family transporter n=1 Tax=Bacillus sp. SA1-12 TaxID=1455638 RepID=UPI0006273AB3|nr:DMT family transporter [Bacillus sp. SA1-12]KKI89444.1 multidrug DMT transporter permease [Bacillus sp. SA1-12]
MKNWHYALVVFLGGCCYGILSTFVKLAYSAGFEVTEVTGGQYFFGSLILWIMVFLTKKKKLTLSQAFKLLASGIPFGLTGVFYYQALQTLNASLAIIFLFQFVWIGTLFEFIFFKKKPAKDKLVSIVILLIGSVLATGIASVGGVVVSWDGTIWALLSALTFTTFIFLSSSVGKGTPPVMKSAFLSTGGLIVVFLVFPPTFLFNLPVLTGIAPYGLLLGFFGVALPPLLFSIGMPKIGPGLGTILTASELPVAVTMSSLILAEHVSLSQWIGVSLILGGIVAGNLKFATPKQKQAEVQTRSIS